ncbi:hypothetical protein [Paenibacillus amylolyticus]|uniref:hypothetical protein n=1 Tax=Paenibacillus amylolyticus TaxID=1451 RepID=UPI00201D86DA|nr:hypothetical protein [Paenibacillus amylolyticus]MCL6663517.1 hypothetical protein [Paenibacillus amylolyticus]
MAITTKKNSLLNDDYCMYDKGKAVLFMTYYDKRSRFITELDSSLYKLELAQQVNDADPTTFLDVE